MLILTSLTLINLWTLISCQNPMMTFNGNSGGAACVFPFKYKGQMYSQCTVLDNDGKPWCATTPDYDANKQWGRCDMRVPGSKTKGGNAGGQNCFFPFTYKGEVFDTCIYRDNDKAWCATTPNYDTDKKWGNCASFMKIPTTGGNTVDQDKCVFPFIYQNEPRSGCIVDPKDGSWCATTDNYDRDRRWAKCMINMDSAGICQNSYTLYVNMYSLRGIGVRWAKTKDECESECNMRSTCVGFDYNKDPNVQIKCAIHDNLSNFRSRNDSPTINQYVVVQRCATDCNTQYDRLDNTLSYGGTDVTNAYTIDDCEKVCSNTSDCFGFDYDANQRSPVKCYIHKSMRNFLTRRGAANVMEFVVTTKVCSSVKTMVGNTNTPMCYFPYKYKGKFYSTCNSKGWNKPWCATTPDYDKDKQWAECDLPSE